MQLNEHAFEYICTSEVGKGEFLHENTFVNLRINLTLTH